MIRQLRAVGLSLTVLSFFLSRQLLLQHHRHGSSSSSSSSSLRMSMLPPFLQNNDNDIPLTSRERHSLKLAPASLPHTTVQATRQTQPYYYDNPHVASLMNADDSSDSLLLPEPLQVMRDYIAQHGVHVQGEFVRPGQKYMRLQYFCAVRFCFFGAGQKWDNRWSFLAHCFL